MTARRDGDGHPDWNARVIDWLGARLTATDSTASRRLARVTLSALLVVGIGLSDHFTGRDYGFTALYLIPVGFAAIELGERWGYVIALEAGVVSILGNARVGTGAMTWNFASRLATSCLIVFLIRAVRGLALNLAEENRRTKEFLDAAAHQLGTPMAGLVASAEAITVETDPARRARSSANLVEAADRLRRLLNALLHLSRYSERPAIERSPVDLVAVCENASAVVEAAHPALSFTVDGPPDLVISSNVAVLGEAISNLLDNAARHARSVVRVTVSDGPTDAVIEVGDDGPGIAPGDEERIFERFVSLDKAGGSGLGLPLAREIARSFGGDVVWAGDRFRLTVDRRNTV